MSQKPSLRLRDATSADLEQIFQLRNEDGVRAVSRRQHPLDRDEFETEILAALDSSDAYVFVIQVGEATAGYLRIEPRADGAWEIGIALEADCRGRGLGTAAIRSAARSFFTERPEAILLALTRPENRASARAFEAAGFTYSGEESAFAVYRAESVS